MSAHNESGAYEVSLMLRRARELNLKVAITVIEWVTEHPPRDDESKQEYAERMANVIGSIISPVGVPARARQIDTETRVETGEGLPPTQAPSSV